MLDEAHKIEIYPGYLLAIPAGTEHGVIDYQAVELCGLMFPPDMLSEVIRLSRSDLFITNNRKNGDSILVNKVFSGSSSPQTNITLKNIFELPLCLSCDTAAVQMLARIFDVVPWDDQTAHSVASNAMHYLAYVVISSFLYLTHTKKTQHHADITQLHILQVKTWMAQHSQDKLRISQLAEMAYLSRSHFTSTFTRVVGVSPKQYLQNLRLQQALKLLETTDLTCETIAMASGYADLATFFIAFKAHTGLTPITYRQATRTVSSLGL